MHIDLDELKARWAEHDAKLDTILRFNQQALAGLELKPARSAMTWLTVSVAFEALVMLATIVLFGSYIADNIGAQKFWIPAAFLDLVAIAFLNNLIRQLVESRQIDYTQPITVIQKKLETISLLRIRYTQGLLLIVMLAWPPLFIVLLKGFFGLDAYALFGWAYIWANVLIGLAVIPLGIWLAKRIGAHASGSPAVRYLIRTINGSGLNAATDFLATLSEFTQESPAC